MKLSVEAVKNIAEEIDALPQEATAYLNRNTGEVYVIVEEIFLDEVESEDTEVLDGVPEWQREDIAKQKTVLNDNAWISLPNAFDIHEWELMERFTKQISNQELQEALLRSIHGSGAFRRFKRELDLHQLRDEWQAFKDACIEELIKDWLRSQNIEFDEEFEDEADKEADEEIDEER